MRKALFTLALLASAFTLPLTAHADTIDDFVLTGDGHTITFSAPAIYSAPNPSHMVTATLPDIASSVNGVGGYSLFISFWLPSWPFRSGLGFEITPSLSTGVPGVFSDYELAGPDLIELLPGTTPTFTVAEFLPGTYSLSTFFVIPQNTVGGIPFTLTITPEAASTPEPSTLLFCATGMMGIAGAIRRRCGQRLNEPESASEHGLEQIS